MGRVLYMSRPAREPEQPSGPRAPESGAARGAPFGAPSSSLLRPGYNCWAVARAQRLALLVDAQAYFRAFHDAALGARRSITVLAWDFNSRTRLHFDPVAAGAPPAELGDFLNFLARRRRGLHINVLNW